MSRFQGLANFLTSPFKSGTDATRAVSPRTSSAPGPAPTGTSGRVSALPRTSSAPVSTCSPAPASAAAPTGASSGNKTANYFIVVQPPRQAQTIAGIIFSRHCKERREFEEQLQLNQKLTGMQLEVPEEIQDDDFDREIEHDDDDLADFTVDTSSDDEEANSGDESD
ncbi:hypothetical protein B0H10DRAFT_1958917 [Mycena sp. CBHHK59/15]|nr:hypothetical protein B0H10DRAFT_1958917 [Mycena sp. CBHHK59/15]